MSREEEEEEEEGWVDEREDSGVGDGVGDDCVGPLRMNESNLEMKEKEKRKEEVLFAVHHKHSNLSTVHSMMHIRSNHFMRIRGYAKL